MEHLGTADHLAWIAHLRKNPGDSPAYADWLQEHNDPAHAVVRASYEGYRDEAGGEHEPPEFPRGRGKYFRHFHVPTESHRVHSHRVVSLDSVGVGLPRRPRPQFFVYEHGDTPEGRMTIGALDLPSAYEFVDSFPDGVREKFISHLATHFGPRPGGTEYGHQSAEKYAAKYARVIARQESRR